MWGATVLLWASVLTANPSVLVPQQDSCWQDFRWGEVHGQAYLPCREDTCIFQYYPDVYFGVDSMAYPIRQRVPCYELEQMFYDSLISVRVLGNITLISDTLILTKQQDSCWVEIESDDCNFTICPDTTYIKRPDGNWEMKVSNCYRTMMYCTGWKKLPCNPPK